jgi:spore germination protein YaaH
MSRPTAFPQPARPISEDWPSRSAGIVCRPAAKSFLLALALSAVAAALWAPTATAAGVCVTKLRFEQDADGLVGKLSWRPPRSLAAGSSFRVFRDGRPVAQTGDSSLLLRARAHRRQLLAVRVVTPSGQLSACVARVRSLLRRGPEPPRRLKVTRVTDSGARVSWSDAHSHDARVAGYRVYRDRSVVRQTKALTVRLRLVSGHRYRVSIASVDSRGHVGPRSKSVRVRTRHYGPRPPSGLGALGVTDTAVTLRWKTAKSRSRPIRGYRVYRDGASLGQVKSNAVKVTRLAPATGYTFTVAAVDSMGATSASTTPLHVKTAMPPPTLGHAHAFLLATTDQSFVDLQAHYRQIGTVYPTYFDCRADTSIVGNDDPLVTRWAQLRRIEVMPRINCQSGSVLNKILNNSSVRSATLKRILDLVDANGYDGVNIDFESGYASDRKALTSFVSELASNLHARGKRISVAVSSKRTETTTGRSGFYDYRALGAVSDYVFVMAWGLHWATSEPGGMNPISWVTEVADYTASMPNKSRFLLGTPLYGMDWEVDTSSSTAAVAMEHHDVMALSAAVGRAPHLAAFEQEWHFGYRDVKGVQHHVWFEDATTVAQRMQLARSRGLGVGFWRLGSEDQRLWDQPLLAPGVAWP